MPPAALTSRSACSARTGTEGLAQRNGRKRRSDDEDSEQQALITRMLKEKTPSGISKIAQQLREGGHLRQAREYTSVVVAYSRKKAWCEASQVLAEMYGRSITPKAVAYNNAMSACLKAEAWGACLQLLQATRARGISRDLFCYTNSLSACGKLGRWEDALKLLWNMLDDKVAPDTAAFNAAIAACEISGRWQWALQLLKAMGQANAAADDITHRTIMRVLERAEQQLRELRLGLARSHLPPVAGTGPGAAVSLHFCIIQSDELGLDGWSLEAGSKHRRWDTLLLGLLQSFMMDGQWLQDVVVTVFIGADVIHANSDVQQLVMRKMGGGRDGKPFYQPATVKAWEETLWNARGQEGSGLRWQVTPGKSMSQSEARRSLLENVDQFLQQEADGAGVIALTARADMTYDELKERGRSRTSNLTKLFVLMGGAHGFDGEDDQDGGAFLDALLNRFSARFGAGKVAQISLSDSPEVVFPLSKVTSFVSVEHARGDLKMVAAGL
eukprot:TRINITY_DN52096_c0_g1_i1.p1 TRINITY_DN52096_c0_g1~~TRINITY_DN52096_c0_g1_i1.p1  ORF type:complete len:520 (+),score=120.66 TRINITY_DN52096_c0_g1_i1:66-1562(+)